MNKSISLLAALGALALLSACGGSTSGNLDNPPVAIVSAPEVGFTILAGTTYTLDGSRSSDPEHAQLKFNWSVQGPSQTTALSPRLLASTAAICDFVAYGTGTYYVTLVVNDGRNNSQPVTTEILVKSRPLITPVTAIDNNVIAVTSTKGEGNTITVIWTSTPSNVLPPGDLAPPVITNLPIRMWITLPSGTVLTGTDTLVSVSSSAPATTTHSTLFTGFTPTDASILEYFPKAPDYPAIPTLVPNSLQWVIPRP